MVTTLLNLLTVTFILAAAFLSIYLFQLVRQQRRRKSYLGRLANLRDKRLQVDPPRGRRRTFTPRPSPPPAFEAPMPRKAFNPRLESRLLVLVNGHAPTAQRLVSRVRHTNPNRSPDWCLEKVIYDLERDRH